MLDAKNLVVLQGGVTRDPKETDAGKPFRFSIGVDFAGNDRVKTDSKSGYFDIIVFANKGETYDFSRKLKKGDRVSVIGSLRWNHWQQDGTDRYGVEVVGEHIRYASTGSGKKPDAANGEAAADTPAAEGEPATTASGNFVI